MTSSCAQRPASWANSQMSVSLGRVDPTLDARSGALILDVSIDSMPGVHAAQISLLNGTVRYDAPFKDSVVTITAPSGRYLLRARRLGARTIMDSVDVRSGYADTVKVMLGRDVVCLL